MTVRDPCHCCVFLWWLLLESWVSVLQSDAANHKLKSRMLCYQCVHLSFEVSSWSYSALNMQSQNQEFGGRERGNSHLWCYWSGDSILCKRRRSGLTGHPERQLADTSRDEKKPQFNECAYFSSSNTCNNTSSMTTITSKKILVLRSLVLGISLASCLDSCWWMELSQALDYCSGLVLGFLQAAQRCHTQALLYMSLPAAWPEAEQGKPSHHPKLAVGLDHAQVRSARNQ